MKTPSKSTQHADVLAKLTPEQRTQAEADLFVYGRYVVERTADGRYVVLDPRVREVPE